MGNTKKKKDRKRKEILKNNSLSMECFLLRFLGIKDKSLMQANLTHQDLKQLFPNLKRTGFDEVLDDPALVYTGEVILVTDSAHNTVPYLNKGLMLDTSDVMDNEDWQDNDPWSKKTETPNVHDYELKSLSNYELVCLLEIYHRSRQHSSYEIVRRELIGRQDSIHASRQSKARVLKKDYKRLNDEEDY